MSQSDSSTEATSVNRDQHLQDVPDGAGCTEIWERLSEHRRVADD